jgi:hypothetical protein
MIHAKRVLVFSAVIGMVIGGCAGRTPSDDAAGTEADLSSSQCPAKIEVQLEAPKISSDDELIQKFESEKPPQTDKEAESSLKMIAPFLTVARADKPVTLSGALMQACAYKTTRTPAGDNAYSMHFSKTASGFSLRIQQLMGGNHQLFINVPITSVSPTSLVADPSTVGFVSAEDTSNSHDGSDGFSISIGTVNVTAKIAD